MNRKDRHRAEAKSQGAREHHHSPLGPLRSSEVEEGARAPKIRVGQECQEEEQQPTPRSEPAVTRLISPLPCPLSPPSNSYIKKSF